MGRSLWPRRTPGATRRGRTSPRNRSTGARRPTVAHKPKPEKVDVCIVGAGASGATAAKVLTESGVNVVALERGPWRRKESFGGDELANVNRYNLWPDPILNPRTYRESETEEPREELF